MAAAGRLAIARWETLARAGRDARPTVLPAPVGAWPPPSGGCRCRASCCRNIEVSTWRALAGFAIGGAIGFVLGLANGLSRLARH